MDTNQSSPQILKASEADLPAIAELAAVVWRSYYPGIISAEQIDYMLARMYSAETLVDEVRHRGICYERLLEGGEFAGFASYGPTDQANLYKLHKIYLHPKWHGLGLGSIMLRHCEREVRRRGATALTLTVNKRNSRAIAAYQRNGFAIMDSIVVDIGGGFFMDDFVMSRDLTA